MEDKRATSYAANHFWIAKSNVLNTTSRDLEDTTYAKPILLSNPRKNFNLCNNFSSYGIINFLGNILFGFHHQLNLVRGTVLASSGSSPPSSPDRSCGGSNHGHSYQVQRQSPLNH
jgi:hypothetical protein